MIKQIINKAIGLVFIALFFTGCKSQRSFIKSDKVSIPVSFDNSKDSINTAEIKWKDFFGDKNLTVLIDTALKNNLELLTTLQNIEIAKNDVRFRKGFLFPNINASAGAGLEKVGTYTSQGAGDASAYITPGQVVPENLGDFYLGLTTSWEVDVWGKLRNSKKAAFSKYLGTIEGRNFVITNLIGEVSNTYYELLSLDGELKYVKQMIQLQKNALEIVRIQKDAARVTELAVKQFEAEVFNSQSLQFQVQQQITEGENKLNFLLGRYSQPIIRDTSVFTDQLPMPIKAGIPSQLLSNRPDIKQAEFELYAAKCDVKAAKAEFYPSFAITGGIGFNAFKPSFLFTSPESIIYSIAGDLVAPLVNRTAIKAEFNKAKAYQVEAMYEYQKSILNAFVEVSNEMSNINNLQQAYDQKFKAVDALSKSIDISNNLFKSGKADYLEVLMVQREALDSRLELIEVKKHQFISVINIYKALGGGWR